jgi:hypothetical protein
VVPIRKGVIVKSLKKPRRQVLHDVSLRGILALSLLRLLAPSRAEESRQPRIVFVGDSITDGHTYPQLVRQALAEAGKPVPVIINAAIAGDTARGMRLRIERDVLVHRPTLVTLSVGINDVLH